MNVEPSKAPEKLVHASIIPSDSIQLCKRPDGKDWLLGMGSFGMVSPSLSIGPPFQFCLPGPSPPLPVLTCLCLLAPVVHFICPCIHPVCPGLLSTMLFYMTNPYTHAFQPLIYFCLPPLLPTAITCRR